MTKLARPVAAYLRENVHYTFAGFNFPATFLDLMLEVGVERIMFSCDHPYGSMAEARAFLDQFPSQPPTGSTSRTATRSGFLTCRRLALRPPSRRGICQSRPESKAILKP